MEYEFLQDTKLPLILSNSNDKSLSYLHHYIEQNKEALLQQLGKHGALLLRGFDISSPIDFENTAKKIDSNLKNDYLGTSPRDQVAGTDFVFSASELANFYPIMQHCEMSFLPHPPDKLFFFCHTSPTIGGETPICDFRQVYKDLDEKIRAEFEAKGVMTVRNYAAPGQKSVFNLFELKSWEQMFLTNDKDVIARKCAENGIELEWYGKDNLRLINKTPAVISHPVTKEKVWFNHTQVFHVAASAIEYEFIHKRQKRMKTLWYALLSKALVLMKKITTSPINMSMHTLFGDGTAIPDAYVRHIEEVIWKNMVIFPWQKGDILVLDNFSTSHGRLPYEGPREILVSWSA
jgi:alpha-ketoglutarate-dependent taurine dioxygenase